MKISRQILSLILLFGFASLALSATYKYQDESGSTVYSQNPPEDPAIPYEVLGDIPSRARPGTDTPPSSSPSLPQDEEESNNIADQQQQEAEKTRQKNCAAAKKNLEIYTVYRRVQNEDGNMVRLNDDQRQQKIDEAKQAIKQFCH